MTQYVTPEYLQSHGFTQYNSQDEGDIFQIPFFDEHALHFREVEFDRNMFVVVLWPMEDNTYNHMIYVQGNAGCGFSPIPERWVQLLIEHLEAIYFGIRGEKPKRTINIQIP